MELVGGPMNEVNTNRVYICKRKSGGKIDAD